MAGTRFLCTNNSDRALVQRVTEACSLLRLLSAHNLGRLALRQLGSGAVDMAKLSNLVRAVQSTVGERKMPYDLPW